MELELENILVLLAKCDLGELCCPATALITIWLTLTLALFFILSSFLYPATKKWWSIILYPPNGFDCPSIRLSALCFQT